MLLALITLGAVWFMTDWLDTALSTAPSIRISPDGDDFAKDPGAVGIDRVPGKYTFLVMGKDESNTDTIMLGTFDTENLTLEIVNIPRDTLANVSWPTKKINSIYAKMRHQHSSNNNSETAAMEATLERFKDIIGFKVDYWVMVDFRGFASLVDAIGGVDYNVPLDMHHSGRTLPSGMQHLNGEDALHVVRFRGFNTADIGRIGSQQDFLTVMAQQLLAKRDSLRVRNLAEVFLKYTVTDMTLQNLVWFGEKFLELDSENIRFHIMPGNYWDSVNNVSYVTINVDEWLNLINTYINPWRTDKTLDNFSIFTRDSNGKLYVTDGNREADASWGN
jgi:LCP family protein required for cell wall assembly